MKNKTNSSRIETEAELFEELKEDHGAASTLTWFESKREFLSILRNHFRTDIRVLNVGCGIDNFSQEIGNQCFYVCSDLIFPLLCKNQNSWETLPVCCDVRRLPFNDSSFDIVFCIDLIHHFVTEDIRVPLGEMFRVTKPGGYILIEEPNKFALFRLPLSFFSHSALLKIRHLKRRILKQDSGPADYEAPLGYQEVCAVVRSLGSCTVKRIPSYPYITTSMILAKVLFSILNRSKMIAKLFGWHWIMEVKRNIK